VADRVWRHDHLIERQQRVRGIDRLLCEDVERGAR
jgi:hypothetical protein